LAATGGNPAATRDWREARVADAVAFGLRPIASTDEREGAMSQLITRCHLIGALEHVLAIVVGFILMVLGLGLGVTMIMLPLGLVIGLIGLALFIGGMCVRFEWI
jgi:hypothetical protein